MIPLLLLLGCPRSIPDHLKLDPPTEHDAQAAPLESVDDAISQIVGSDPLVRAPKLPDITQLRELEDSEPLVAYLEAIRSVEGGGDADVAITLEQLEQQYPGTIAVPLSRGYRLRLIESYLPRLEGAMDPSAERKVLALLTPLLPSDIEQTLPQESLRWIGRDLKAIRRLAEQRVLLGWLNGPEIPLDAAAAALSGPQHDRIRATQAAQTLLMRAGGRDAAGDTLSAGWRHLRDATHLALNRAAADRDREQAAWSDLKRTTAELLGEDSPISFLLQQAFQALLPHAGEEESTGGILLALQAARWEESCDTPPCTGIDRVSEMAASKRWGPRTAALAAVWQVIALKESLDTMDVGYETVLFPRAMVLLSDALLGTGAGPLEAHLLLRKRPDSAVWLALGRATGTDASTDWTSARTALGRHLQQHADAAHDLSNDLEIQELLRRISSRAVD